MFIRVRNKPKSKVLLGMLTVWEYLENWRILFLVRMHQLLKLLARATISITRIARSCSLKI